MAHTSDAVTAAPVTTDPNLDVFADAPAAEQPRPRVLLVGTAFAAAAASIGVCGLVALYTQVRAQSLGAEGTWLPEDTVIPLTPGNFGLLSLCMSLVTAAWAVYALRNADRVHALLGVAVTIVFGLSYVTDTAYLWQQSGLVAGADPQAVLIYTITGAHVAMAAAGMLYLLVMGFRSLGGQLTGRAAEGMEAAALFWYATVAVYAVVWYTIYVTK
jgi:heme/copper-type cytochrome/quinol oxidase subunit 3